MSEVTLNETNSLIEQFIEVIDESKEVINSDSCEAMRTVCKTTCSGYNA